VFFQEGAVLSSKSAINVLAPEFKALIIIFSIYWTSNLTRLVSHADGTWSNSSSYIFSLFRKFGNFLYQKIVCCSSRRSNISSLSALNFHEVQ
jgi:hypothetical protein